MPVFEKVRIALFITWWWSFINLKFAQFLHYCFSIFLLLPDKVVGKIVGYKPLYNTYKEKIEIISARIDARNLNDARDEGGMSVDVKNKFNAFLRFFWEDATQKTIHDSAGFDAKLFFKMFRAAVLHCHYVITDKNRVEYCITVLNDHIAGIIARRSRVETRTQADEAHAQAIEAHDADRDEPIAFGHIHFDAPDLIRETNIHLNALLNDPVILHEELD